MFSIVIWREGRPLPYKRISRQQLKPVGVGAHDDPKGRFVNRPYKQNNKYRTHL